MEIGHPTDVRHVAHIGWDGPHGSGPSWMKEFKTAPDFTTSLGNLGDRRDSKSINTASDSTQDFEQSSGHQRTSNIFKEIPPLDQLPQVPKKQKKKKVKSNTSSSSSRQPKAAISTTVNERGVTPTIKV